MARDDGCAMVFRKSINLIWTARQLLTFSQSTEHLRTYCEYVLAYIIVDLLLIGINQICLTFFLSLLCFKAR